MLEDSDYLYDRVVEINDKLEEFPTLRDQFAMDALSSGTCPYNSYQFKEVSQWSYKMADAMLKAREVKEVNEGD